MSEDLNFLFKRASEIKGSKANKKDVLLLLNNELNKDLPWYVIGNFVRLKKELIEIKRNLQQLKH